MKFQHFFSIVIIMLIAACGPSGERKAESVPDHLLSVDKMAALISDIQITEAVLQQQKASGLNEQEQSKDYFREIFSKHGVSYELYSESKQFYEANPKLYEEVFEKAITLMTRQQTELTNPKTKEEKKEEQ